MSETATQSEFAQLQGWSRSYISKLKADGRLVMTDDGKRVRVTESVARIRETAEPNRDDVALRHATARGEDTPAADEPPRTDSSFQRARSQKEHYLSLQAKLDYEKAAGEQLPRAAVVKVMTDAATTINTELENVLDTLPPQVAGIADVETVRARCHDIIEQLQQTVARLFSQAADKARANT